MDNGGINTYDVGTLAGLRGVGTGGYGYGNQGNFLGDGSAVKEAVRGNRDIDLLDAVNRGTSDQFLSQKITDGDAAVVSTVNMGNQFLTDRINAQGIDAKFANVTERLASAERIAFANQASLEREMNANQAAAIAQLHTMDVKQTECCCELKAGQAAILAKLDADRANAAENEVNNLRLQLNVINSQDRGQGN